MEEQEEEEKQKKKKRKKKTQRQHAMCSFGMVLDVLYKQAFRSTAPSTV